MRRVILSILGALLLLAAAASEAPRSAKGRSKASTAARKKSTKKKAPTIKINYDSIEAARRQQLRVDSLNAMQALVDAGDISAIVDMGMWYYTGHIVDQDYSKAVDLWSKAAEAPSARALANLGICYELGHGVPQDLDRAATLYVQSIKEGNGTLFKQKLDSAATNVFDALLIGECYEKGEGVRRDLVRAADLYSKAAALGSDAGVCRAALCYMAAGDTVMAMEYLPLGAKLGNVPCRYYNGAIALVSSPSEAEARQAVADIMEAASSGMPEAQYSAAEIYRQGKYVNTDVTKAADMMLKAAMQDYAPAMYGYAAALAGAQGVRADYDAALTWWAKASGAGYDADPQHLGTSTDAGWSAYLQGMKSYIVDKDYANAIKWFKHSEKASKTLAPKVMQQVIIADRNYDKANPQKAAKTLESMVPDSPMAAWALAGIYADADGPVYDAQRASFLTEKARQSGYEAEPDLVNHFITSIAESSR